MLSVLMDEWNEFKEMTSASPVMLRIAVIVCLLGGVMRGIRCPRDNFTLWGFFQRVLAAAFIGSITWLLGANFGISESLNAAITGASGYAGIDVLQCLTPWVKRHLKIERVESLKNVENAEDGRK